MDQWRILRLQSARIGLSDRRLRVEREPLETIAGRGQLIAYQHDGFWSAWARSRTIWNSTSCGTQVRRRGRFGDLFDDIE